MTYAWIRWPFAHVRSCKACGKTWLIDLLSVNVSSLALESKDNSLYYRFHHTPASLKLCVDALLIAQIV
jgi:hypothetical protein